MSVCSFKIVFNAKLNRLIVAHETDLMPVTREGHIP